MLVWSLNRYSARCSKRAGLNESKCRFSLLLSTILSVCTWNAFFVMIWCVVLHNDSRLKMFVSPSLSSHCPLQHPGCDPFILCWGARLPNGCVLVTVTQIRRRDTFPARSVAWEAPQVHGVWHSSLADLREWQRWQALAMDRWCLLVAQSVVPLTLKILFCSLFWVFFQVLTFLAVLDLVVTLSCHKQRHYIFTFFPCDHYLLKVSLCE